VSGLIRGKIECNVTTNFNRLFMAQACFKLAYDYFTSHPNYTLIALNYGSTAGPATTGAGTGTGFFDAPASFGYHAFFVVRSNATTTRPYDVYHLFQWSGSVNQGGGTFGSSPGNPGLVNGSTSPVNGNATYMGYAAAIGVGGTGGSVNSPNNGNPWKGTSAANGSDTKGASVWGVPPGGGTGVIIFPRSNSNFGSHRQLTQNMGGIIGAFQGTDPSIRLNFIGDDDSFAIMLDNETGGSQTLCYSGIYTARNNLTVPYPYCVIGTYFGLPWSISSTTSTSIFGDLAGTNSNQGGIVSPLSATVGPLIMDQYALVTQNSDFWPNRTFSQPTFDEHDIPVAIYDFGGPSPTAGLVGQIDFLRLMYNVQTNGMKSDFSRIFLGSTTMADRKYSIPWDNQFNTVPRSGLTRNGVTFVRAAGA